MRSFALLLLLCSAAFAGACSPRAGDDGALTLTYATQYSPSHPFSRADAAWISFVEQRSEGRLRIRPYWSGGLLSADSSIIEIRHGLADIGLITPIYTRGGVHAQRMQTGFYGGVRTMQDQLDVYACLFEEFPVLEEELEGLHVLAVQAGNFPGVLTRDRPVRTLEDLRGMRIRAPTEIVPVLRALGSDPVSMPMGEVYSALAKNIIDGVIAPTDTFQSLHFSEVARYYTEARFSRGAYPARAMGREAWERLPAELQAVLTEATAVWEQAIMDELTAAEVQGAAFGREQGIEFVPFGDEDQAQLDQSYNEWAARSSEHLLSLEPAAAGIFERAQELVAARNGGAARLCDGASS
jgi:TRAP-type C4-dicarboxylate transport system substrate-binding protein